MASSVPGVEVSKNHISLHYMYHYYCYNNNSTVSTSTPVMTPSRFDLPLLPKYHHIPYETITAPKNRKRIRHRSNKSRRAQHQNPTTTSTINTTTTRTTSSSSSSYPAYYGSYYHNRGISPPSSEFSSSPPPNYYPEYAYATLPKPILLAPSSTTTATTTIPKNYHHHYHHEHHHEHPHPRDLHLLNHVFRGDSYSSYSATVGGVESAITRDKRMFGGEDGDSESALELRGPMLDVVLGLFDGIDYDDALLC